MTTADPTIKLDYTDVTEIARLAWMGVDPKLLDLDQVYLVTDSTGTVKTVSTFDDKYRAEPRRIERNGHHTDWESFARYIICQGDQDARDVELWAAPDQADIVAILDPPERGRPSRQTHTTTYHASHTADYVDWKNISGQWLSQAMMTEFIEDHLDAFTDPDSATMLEIAESINGVTKATFESSHIQSNGQRMIVWREETEATAGHTSKGQLTIPTRLKLVLTPYGHRTEYVALFKYRIEKGNLALGIKLLNVAQTELFTFQVIADTITSKIDSEADFTFHVFWGRP